MRRSTLFLVVLLLTAGGTGAGRTQSARGLGSEAPPPLAQAETSPSRLDWTPGPGAGGEPVQLTVAGPQGFYFEKRVPAGLPAAFDLAEVQDRNPPDGAYTYELRQTGANGRKQSGQFSIRDGRIFVPAAGKGPAAPKPSRPAGPSPLQQKAIQGNSCIGDGCGTGDEGNPLRLKDSFVRLDFTDDFDGFSVDHDWAIQANDAIGGGEYLAILDVGNSTVPVKVVAGAPSDSLVVSASGKVGIGTSTPAVSLDAKANAASAAVVRLQNQSSSGYSAVEYLDQSGNVDLFFGIDNANSNTRLNSVNNNPITILTNSTERIRITSGGDIGIGTSSPTDKLDVRLNAAGKAGITVINTHASGFSGIEGFDENGTSSFFLGTDNSNNNTRFNSQNSFPIVFLLNGTERLRFPTTGNVITAANGAFLSNGGTWTNASSRALKQDIHDLDARAAFAALKSLNPVEFAYKSDPNEQHVGFIAEDVPDLVAEQDRKGLSPMDVVAVLTKVVQEQQKTIEALTAEVRALKSQP